MPFKKATQLAALLIFALSLLFTSTLLLANDKHKAYQHVYFFGDSLTDAGWLTTWPIWRRANPYKGVAYFTQPGGQNWTIYFQNSYPISQGNVTPCRYGGKTTFCPKNANNFAQGGAVTRGIGIPQTYKYGIKAKRGNFASPNAVSLQIRYQQRIHKKYGKERALYIIFAGSNDIIKALMKNPKTVMQKASTAAKNIKQSIKRIKTSNPNASVMIMNLADIGDAPFAQKQGKKIVQLLNEASEAFNEKIASSKGIILFNTHQLFKSINGSAGKSIRIANQNFHFKNTSIPLCNTEALYCSHNDLKPGYLFISSDFAGPVHPSDLTNRALGLAVAQCLKDLDQGKSNTYCQQQ